MLNKFINIILIFFVFESLTNPCPTVSTIDISPQPLVVKEKAQISYTPVASEGFTITGAIWKIDGVVGIKERFDPAATYKITLQLTGIKDGKVSTGPESHPPYLLNVVNPTLLIKADTRNIYTTKKYGAINPLQPKISKIEF